MADYPQQDRDLGLRKTRLGGRFVTTYTPELALEMCEQIAEGATLKGLCEGNPDKYPSRSTFNRWVVQYPELSRAYAAARELSAHSFEEEALDIARTLAAEGRDFTSTKVRAFDTAIGQLRWSASRRNPKTYSERGSVQITVPIQINTSLDLGDGGMLGVDHPDIYKLEAVTGYKEVDDAELMQADAPVLAPPQPNGVRKETREERIRKRLDGELPVPEGRGW